jgi:prepilin-type N-terminal cleavage/methylation domain-containing protein
MLKKFKPNLKTNQSGDTIIEVMIAVIIIGALMVGGYAVSNKSLEDELQAEQRSEANGILQGQFDLMRAYLVNDGTTGSNNSKLDGYTAHGFCMNVSSSVIIPVDLATAGPPPNQCTFSNTYGTPSGGVTSYQVIIKPGTDTNPVSSGGPGPDFHGVVTWDGGAEQLSYWWEVYGNS